MLMVRFLIMYYKVLGSSPSEATKCSRIHDKGDIIKHLFLTSLLNDHGGSPRFNHSCLREGIIQALKCSYKMSRQMISLVISKLGARIAQKKCMMKAS